MLVAPAERCMASITIRQLDEGLKRRLRLRAARNGRSMEDEARTILRTAAALDDKAQLEEAAGSARILQREPKRRGVRADAVANTHARRTQRILLIIGGGIAAYKALDLIRRLKEHSLAVRCILTRAAQEFITPLSAGALSGERAFTGFFDPDSEVDGGHTRLAREAALLLAAPPTPHPLGKLAGGHADALASAVLLATERSVLLAPAMNPRMWEHKATQRNLTRLIEDGIAVVGPNTGEMAEAGEAGIGRMAEPLEIVAAALQLIAPAAGEGALAGKRVIVPSGPTPEPNDPVRHIPNPSSGNQGHAL